MTTIDAVVGVQTFVEQYGEFEPARMSSLEMQTKLRPIRKGPIPRFAPLPQAAKAEK